MIDSSDFRSRCSLLVVMPCLNEAPTIQRVIRGLPRSIAGVTEIQVLVIDDGSTDGTADLAREAGADVVVHDKNQGLGSSFQEAVSIALQRGVDLLVSMDGDGQFDPAHLPLLVQPILGDGAGMVTASRFLDKNLVPKMPAIKRWGNRRVANLVALLSGQRFEDVSCGFRAFSHEALLRMNLFGSFTYTQESFMDLLFKGLPIVEVPVEVRGVREFGNSRVASSIPRYALRSLQIMLRAFISYRPFRFFFVIAAFFGAIGLGLLIFLLAHYLRSGAFSPHIWSGFVGGSFALLAILTLVLALLADMLVRIRVNQENILYHLKRRRWEQVRQLRRGADGQDSA
jgi:glycosyltransferase involved in cell wall biosynthesis